MAEHQPLKALLIILNLIFLIVAVIFATIAATDENSGEGQKRPPGVTRTFWL